MRPCHAAPHPCYAINLACVNTLDLQTGALEDRPELAQADSILAICTRPPHPAAAYARPHSGWLAAARRPPSNACPSGRRGSQAALSAAPAGTSGEQQRAEVRWSPESLRQSRAAVAAAAAAQPGWASARYAGSRAAVCQAAATDTLELTEENVELVLDEVGAAGSGRVRAGGSPRASTLPPNLACTPLQPS